MIWRNGLGWVFQPNKGGDLEEWNDIYQDEMESKDVVLKEVQKEIKENWNPEKEPGLDPATEVTLKKFHPKNNSLITNLINAPIRLKYVSINLKVIVMLAKPGKAQNEISSYSPVRILSTVRALRKSIVVRYLERAH